MLLWFVYYGGLIEFFFVIFMVILIIIVIGFWWNEFMWGCVCVLEIIVNFVGCMMVWVGFVMVLI